MKKLFIASAIAMFGLVSAQKNTLLVGGNIDFTSEKTGDYKENSFEFNPKVGYQFADHWTAGIESSIGSSKTKNSVTTQSDMSNFSIGAFGRYTMPLNETFAFFTDLGVGYQSIKNKLSDAKADGMYAQLTPALFINFKNSFGLNFSIGGLGYGSMKPSGGGDSTNSFNLNFGKTVSIGISKNFGLK